MAAVQLEEGDCITTMAECDDVFEAEDFIAMMERVDPDGVHDGRYTIDATEYEHEVIYQTARAMMVKMHRWSARKLAKELAMRDDNGGDPNAIAWCRALERERLRRYGD